VSLPHQRQHPERDRGDPDREQQVGVGGAGVPRFDRRRVGHLGQPRVAGLPDLHRAVVDELRGDEAGAGGDQDHGRGPGGGDDLAEGSGQAHQQ
jgi:hypothetical protein